MPSSRQIFFHIDTALGKRLYALAFLEHGTRRLHITGVTGPPTREWAVQQARNLTLDLGIRMESLHFALRVRDGKYGQAFDAVFEAEELEVINSAPQAPRMNAHCERIIGTIHAKRSTTSSSSTRATPAASWTPTSGTTTGTAHQARNQLPPDAHDQPAPVHNLTSRRMLRSRILGGVINAYRYAA